MSNNNHDQLNQLILRTMLLEGGSGERVIKNVRRYVKGGRTAEDKQQLISDIRKEVTLNSKEIMAEERLSSFIDELSDNV